MSIGHIVVSFLVLRLEVGLQPRLDEHDVGFAMRQACPRRHPDLRDGQRRVVYGAALLFVYALGRGVPIVLAGTFTGMPIAALPRLAVLRAGPARPDPRDGEVAQDERGRTAGQRPGLEGAGARHVQHAPRPHGGFQDDTTTMQTMIGLIRKGLPSPFQRGRPSREGILGLDFPDAGARSVLVALRGRGRAGTAEGGSPAPVQVHPVDTLELGHDVVLEPPESAAHVANDPPRVQYFGAGFNVPLLHGAPLGPPTYLAV